MKKSRGWLKRLWDMFWGRFVAAWWRRWAMRVEICLAGRYLLSVVERDLPLDEGLEAYAAGQRSRWLKDVFGAMAEDLKKGKTFSSALSRHSPLIPNVFLTLIKTGEEAEDVPGAVRLGVRALEREREMTWHLLTVYFYILMMMPVFLLICLFHMTFVVPTFRIIYESWGHELPLLTQIVLEILPHWFWYFLHFAGISLLAAVLLTLRGDVPFTERISSRIPYLRDLAAKERETRFASGLASLLQAGCPLEKALLMLKDMTGTGSFRILVETARESVLRGESLSGALRRAGGFTSGLVWACSLGEERDKLADTLSWLCGYNDLWIRARISCAAPVIRTSANVFAGVLVGFIVIAMFLPLFDMAGLVPN